MASRLVGAKQLSEPMLECFNTKLRERLWWNIKPNSYIFIQENAFEKIRLENGGQFASASIYLK